MCSWQLADAYSWPSRLPPIFNCFRIHEQLDDLDAEGNGQDFNRVERRVRATALDPAHVTTRKAAVLREGLLADADALTKAPHPGSERNSQGLAHPKTVIVCVLLGHALIVTFRSS